MNPHEPPVPRDPLAEAAALIRDLGRSAQRARCYRDLATKVAEPIFDRALAIGSEVRQGARGGDPQPTPAVTAAIAELRELLARCEAAIGRVRASAPYQEAAAAFTAGAAERAAPLAAAIFTDVISYAPAGTLYWAVPISSGRPGVHFLAAGDLAARVHTIVTDGLPADTQPPDLGGDETIRPVFVTDQRADAESPIALAFEPQTLPAAACRLAGSSIVLFYAERLRADFTVSCTATVDDEWWNIRPDAYREYLEELREALSARALRVVIER